MKAEDYNGAQVWVALFAELVQGRYLQQLFLSCALEKHGEAWRRFAASRGRAPDDEGLVLDATLVVQEAILEAGRLLEDQMRALRETRRILEDGEPPAV